jgi:glycosyltransferase involved in cell wall biosynthesis
VARVVVVSFRLGAIDGVSIEAAKWIAALRSLGHLVTTVAGAGEADVLMPELAMDATHAPSRVNVIDALDGADLVIVENLVSLPFNVAARDALYEALNGRPAIFRHHDLAWQREQWREEAAPRSGERWRHVTINERSRLELEERGVESVTFYNAFDCDPPRGRRDGTRRELGLTAERLLLMPTRAIARKNVAGAMTLASTLDAVLWLLGPTEEAYDATLDALLPRSSVQVIRGLPDHRTIDDAYAACDFVTLPSTWEGFGNPVLESVTHRRPLAVYPYPVLEEIRAFGFAFFDLSDVEAITAYLESPDDGMLHHNLEIAREYFNLNDLPRRLASLLASIGVE